MLIYFRELTTSMKKNNITKKFENTTEGVLIEPEYLESVMTYEEIEFIEANRKADEVPWGEGPNISVLETPKRKKGLLNINN